MPMKVDDYVTIKVPKGLIGEVDKIVNDESRGFRSRNEFCIHAIRKEVEMQNYDFWRDKSKIDPKREKKVVETLLASKEAMHE